MSPVRELWRRLPAHAALLAVVLAALVPLLDNGSMVSADEGATLAQLEVLETTGGWALPNPYPEVDPDGRWFGFEKSDRNGDDFYPYAKHAAYPVAMRPFFAVGELRGVLFASAFGTWCAAVLAAVLARRLFPGRGLAVPTLWVVGIVSPVFFDSFWVIAHSIGAAFATGAALAAVAAVCGRGPRRWASVVGVVVGLLGSALFRGEGVLFALSLAVAAGVTAVLPVIRSRRIGAIDPVAAVLAVVAAASGLAARSIDAGLATRIMGASQAPFTIPTDESWVSGRMQGIWSSVLRPQLMDPTPAGGLFLAITVIGVIAAVYVRRAPDETRLIRSAAVAAGVLALVAVVLPKAPVPGLVVAFPLLPMGVVLLGRSTLGQVGARLVVGTGAVFVGAVVLTQYSIGGSMEWGGRYFHLALPMLVPVLLDALAVAGRRLDRTTARLAGGSLALVSAVLVAFAVGTVVRLHTVTKPIVDTVVAAATAGVGGDEALPVVTNMEALGRLAWRDAVHGRYLAVPESDELDEVARSLRAEGVDEFVFASAWEHQEDRARLRGYTVVPGTTERVSGWEIVVMRRS